MLFGRRGSWCWLSWLESRVGPDSGVLLLLVVVDSERYVYDTWYDRIE